MGVVEFWFGNEEQLAIMHIMARCKLMVALLLVNCFALCLSGITSCLSYIYKIGELFTSILVVRFLL